MGIMFAFILGWTVGCKSGPKGFQDVTDAVRTVRESEEFEALVEITRSHVATGLQELGKLLSGETSAPEPADLLSRVQRLTAARPAR